MTAPLTTPDPLVNEVRMLLDFVTGSSVQTLKDLVIPNPDVPQSDDEPTVTMKNTDILNRLNKIETQLTKPGAEPLSSPDRTLLQVLRDALGAMVRPATGLTIAYSTMVVGRQRGAFDRSRAHRAENAYPDLAGPALRHRWAQRFLLFIAVLVTAGAVWQSAHVALGRALLQNVQSLQTRQAALAQEMTTLLEANRPPPPATPIVIAGVTLPASPILRLCDRPRALTWKLQHDGNPALLIDADHAATLFESPAEQALCDRDTILAGKFLLAHQSLIRYVADWVSVVSPGQTFFGRIETDLRPTRANASPSGPVQPAIAEGPAPDQVDVDAAIAPVLLVWGNYFLPIVFALLGATVYVILDFYSKLRDSLLAPRDAVLSWIRLVLGMVLGACVGLFFSTANPSLGGTAPNGAALADSIALSASGLAFIAGFGVEGVFGMLDSLVRRIFSANQDRSNPVVPG